MPGEDEAAWVAVNNRAFAGHPEQGAWTVEMLRRREREPWFDPAGFLLAFDADGLAGSCWTKIHPPQPPREPDALGEIYVIGADPTRQGRGLGRALTAGGLASLAARGITVGMLFVDADNEAARRPLPRARLHRSTAPTAPTGSTSHRRRRDAPATTRARAELDDPARRAAASRATAAEQVWDALYRQQIPLEDATTLPARAPRAAGARHSPWRSPR